MVKIMPHYQSTNIILSIFFFKDNYNMLLISQLELFPPKPPSTLCMERCQFSYKAFVSFKNICMHNSNEHAVKLRRLEILDLIKSIVLKH